MIRFSGQPPYDEVVDSRLHRLDHLLRIRMAIGEQKGFESSEYLNADIEYHLAKEAKDGTRKPS